MKKNLSLIFFLFLAISLSSCNPQSLEAVAQFESLSQDWAKTTSSLTNWINRVEHELLNLRDAEAQITESLMKHDDGSLQVNSLIDSLHTVWYSHEMAYLRLMDKVHISQLQGSEQLLTLSHTLDQLNADMVSVEAASQTLTESDKLLGTIQQEMVRWNELLETHKLACRSTCKAYGDLIGGETSFAVLIP